jgi:hypothetical protein
MQRERGVARLLVIVDCHHAVNASTAGTASHLHAAHVKYCTCRREVPAPRQQFVFVNTQLNCIPLGLTLVARIPSRNNVSITIVTPPAGMIAAEHASSGKQTSCRNRDTEQVKDIAFL